MDETPIFDSVVTDLKFNPKDEYVEPKGPGVLGYKAKRKISGMANRAIATVVSPRPIITVETGEVL